MAPEKKEEPQPKPEPDSAGAVADDVLEMVSGGQEVVDVVKHFNFTLN